MQAIQVLPTINVSLLSGLLRCKGTFCSLPHPVQLMQLDLPFLKSQDVWQHLMLGFTSYLWTSTTRAAPSHDAQKPPDLPPSPLPPGQSDMSMSIGTSLPLKQAISNMLPTWSRLIHVAFVDGLLMVCWCFRIQFVCQCWRTPLHKEESACSDALLFVYWSNSEELMPSIPAPRYTKVQWYSRQLLQHLWVFSASTHPTLETRSIMKHP